MNGTVIGGWGFVWAAYIVSAIVLGGYAAYAITCLRKASHNEP